jgi:hypothetical protein
MKDVLALKESKRRELKMWFKAIIENETHIIMARQSGVKTIQARDAKIGVRYKFYDQSEMIVEGRAAVVMKTGSVVMNNAKGDVVFTCFPAQLLMPIEGPSNEKVIPTS